MYLKTGAHTDFLTICTRDLSIQKPSSFVNEANLGDFPHLATENVPLL